MLEGKLVNLGGRVLYRVCWKGLLGICGLAACLKGCEKAERPLRTHRVHSILKGVDLCMQCLCRQR